MTAPGTHGPPAVGRRNAAMAALAVTLMQALLAPVVAAEVQPQVGVRAVQPPGVSYHAPLYTGPGMAAALPVIDGAALMGADLSGADPLGPMPVLPNIFTREGMGPPLRLPGDPGHGGPLAASPFAPPWDTGLASPLQALTAGQPEALFDATGSSAIWLFAPGAPGAAPLAAPPAPPAAGPVTGLIAGAYNSPTVATTTGQAPGIGAHGLPQPERARHPNQDITRWPSLTRDLSRLERLACPHPVPDAAMRDGSGRVRRLSEFRGRVVLLNLWATWCPPCRMEMPALDHLQAVRGGPEFEVVALSQEALGDVKVPAFYADLQLTHLQPYIDPDQSLSQALTAPAIPETWVIDREGMVVARLSGPADWSQAQALALIDHVLGGHHRQAAPPPRSDLGERVVPVRGLCP